MQQLNELYNCPCYKTCPTGNPMMPSITYVLSDTQAADCHLNQTDANGVSIDTCCDDDSNMVGPSGGEWKNIGHEPLDIEPRDPRGPKGPIISKWKGKDLREIIKKTIREITEEEILHEKEKGCWVMCDWAPSGGKQKEWCSNCRTQKKMDRCCKKSIWHTESKKLNEYKKCTFSFECPDGKICKKGRCRKCKTCKDSYSRKKDNRKKND